MYIFTCISPLALTSSVRLKHEGEGVLEGQRVGEPLPAAQRCPCQRQPAERESNLLTTPKMILVGQPRAMEG